MAGTYNEGTRKVLSGVYSLIKAALDAVQTGSRGIVAYPFTSNWGPVNTLQNITQAPEFATMYNATATTLSASKIYKNGVVKGKPSVVLAYRMATAAAKKGECSLGADSLVLETIYPSDRAFKITVEDSLTGGKTLTLLEGAVKLLEITGATNAELAEQINISDYIRVKTLGTVLPANTASAAFTGGNNGSVVTATEYTAFLEEVEADGTANSFSLDGITDDAIVTLAKEWTFRVFNEGLYITFANGGPSSWDTSISLANAKSLSFNSRLIVNVGNGCEGLTAADMAIFIAARIASVALNRTLTDEVVPYTTVNKKLKPAERVTAKQKGTLIFVQEGKNVLIDEGVNTLTNPGQDERKEFGKIRVSNALNTVTRDLESFGNAYKKERSNTQEARETYAATVEEEYFKSMAALEVLTSDYSYKPDPEYHGQTPIYKPGIDEAFFTSHFFIIDSMEKIYQKLNVKF